MLQNMKKKYLLKIVFLWSFCAAVTGIPLLVGSIKYGKWFIGILGILGIFVVAIGFILIGKLRLTRFEKAVCDQEQRYSVQFSDEKAELLSNNGNVYLSNNWLVNLPKWAFLKEHITEITYVEFESTRSTNDKYCCNIHTVDNVCHTVWVAGSKSVKKIEKWISEK